MRVVIRRSTETRTGISVVKTAGAIETFNVLGNRIHMIDSVHCKHDVLTHRWFGEVFDEEIKEVLGGHFVDAFIESKCTKILADLSQWSTSWDGVNDFLRDDVMPRLAAAGMRHLAVFVKRDMPPEDDANRFALERFENAIENVNASFFSEHEALEWLKTRS
ncbi:hypothetical protein [Sorangium sp. So ce854]|uniref:STAS/SEC14 domain-containing protein n=1 Tax=Sorangium cellulosum TaxID=56 RepID=A0A150P534_SORCE|nr:hypothetical protein BE08_20110 [Sorangium cellulosum]